MADSLGALTIKFLGDIAEFRTAQQQVLDLSKQTAANVNKAFDSVQSSIKGALTGMAAVASFTFVKGQFDAFVSGAAGLKDMSERTGETVEKLSSLVAVAKIGGHSVEGMEAAVLKLTKGMAGADEETKGAGHALEFLGIKSRDAQGNLKSSGAMLEEIAKKLAEYKDGAGKSAVAMDLFGKSGAQLLPFLKDLSEQSELVVKVTAEQAQQADEYEKTIRRLTATKTALHKEIAMGVLPVAQQFAEALLTLKKNNDTVTESAKKLRSEGSIEDWARTGALGVAYVVDAARAIPVVFKAAGAFIAASVGEIANLAKAANAAVYILANPGNAGAATVGMAEIRDAIANAGKMAHMAQDDIDGLAQSFTQGSFVQAVRQQFDIADATKGVAKAAEESRKSLDGYSNATDRAKDAAKAAAAAAQTLRMALIGFEQKNIQIAFDIDQDRIKAEIAALEDQLKQFGGKDLADQITSLQTQAIDRFAENATARYVALVNSLNAEAARLQAMPVGPERDRAMSAYVKEFEKLAPIARELASVEDKRAEASRNSTARIREQIRALEEGFKSIYRGVEDYAFGLNEAKADRELELALIGKTKEEQDKLTVAARAEREIRKLTLELTRLQEDAAGNLTEEQRALNKAAQDAVLIKIQIANAEGEAQKQHAATRKQLEDQDSLWKSIGDTAQNFFADLFQHGSSAFGRLWDQAKAFFAKLAAQLAVKWVLGIDIQGGALGSLGGLFGGGGSGLFGGLSGILGSLARDDGVGGVISGTGILGGLESMFPSLSGILGGLSSVLPMLGPIAAVVGILAPIIKNLDPANTPGIKFGSDALGRYGDQAANHSTFANLLGNFSAEGDAFDSGAGFAALKPFIDKFNAMANKVAGMLTETQLEAVRAQIGKLSTLREAWLTYKDDKGLQDALSKGTAQLLKDVFGTAFEDINGAIASKIAGFTGTSDELSAYIDKVLSGFEVLASLKQQLPDLSLTIDQFVDLTDQQRHDLSTIAAAMRLTQQDIAARADEAYRLTTGGIVNSFIAQGDALDTLSDQYRAGLVPVADMANAIKAFGDSAVQVMVALAQAKDQIDSLVQNGIRTIEMAGLTADERNAYLRNEAERARASLGIETDPEKIRALVSQIVANSTEVFNSLSPEQQAANRANFLDGLNRLRQEAQDRIDRLNALVADNATTTLSSIGKDLTDAVKKLSEVADKDGESADKQLDAANTNLQAANTPLVIVLQRDRSEVGGLL